ncbi:MAG: hypothetical protein Q8S44_04475 [Flavobacteriaceae bacterium]|nr:hypothetical protein [Flavobacteriaceae bacterium]
MKKIKHLMNGINTAAIPDIIYNELSRHGNKRSFTSFVNDKGELVKEFGKLLPPFNALFDYGDFYFFCLEKQYEIFEYFLKEGNYFDENGNQLDKKTIIPFLKEYAKGFQNGYYEFEEKVKNHKSIFTTSNDQMAYNVFTKVYGFFIDNGAFTFSTFLDLEKNELLKKKYNIDFIEVATFDLFYKSGFGGGEFYKAWEIILNNPTLFKSIFEENIKSRENSNSDLMKPSVKENQNENQQIIKEKVEPDIIENPYPRIFTSLKAFNLFNSLLSEFGSSKENVANYSFVFHRMKRDNLIFDDYQQTQFIYFLLEFNINISRIKPKSQLGKIELRESIYNAIK